MQSFAFQYSITQSTIIRVIEMNLSLEAYDWWATKIPTQYRTLASNFDSKSESFQSYVRIGEESEENLFDGYFKVWVLNFGQNSMNACVHSSPQCGPRTCVHRTLI